MNLLRLAQITNRDEFRDRPRARWRRSSNGFRWRPSALPQMLAACEFLLGHPRQIVVAGDRGARGYAKRCCGRSTRAFCRTGIVC